MKDEKTLAEIKTDISRRAKDFLATVRNLLEDFDRDAAQVSGPALEVLAVEAADEIDRALQSYKEARVTFDLLIAAKVSGERKDG